MVSSSASSSSSFVTLLLSSVVLLLLLLLSSSSSSSILFVSARLDPRKPVLVLTLNENTTSPFIISPQTLNENPSISSGGGSPEQFYFNSSMVLDINGVAPPFSKIIVRDLVAFEIRSYMYFMPGVTFIFDNVTIRGEGILLINGGYIEADVARFCARYPTVDIFKNSPSWWEDGMNSDYFLNEVLSPADNGVLPLQRAQTVSIQLINSRITIIDVPESLPSYDGVATASTAGFTMRTLYSCPLLPPSTFTPSSNLITATSFSPNQIQLNIIVKNNIVDYVEDFKMRRYVFGMDGIMIAPYPGSLPRAHVPFVSGQYFAIDISDNTITIPRQLPADKDEDGKFVMMAGSTGIRIGVLGGNVVDFERRSILTNELNWFYDNNSLENMASHLENSRGSSRPFFSPPSINVNRNIISITTTLTNGIWGIIVGHLGFLNAEKRSNLLDYYNQNIASLERNEQANNNNINAPFLMEVSIFSNSVTLTGQEDGVGVVTEFEFAFVPNATLINNIISVNITYPESGKLQAKGWSSLLLGFRFETIYEQFPLILVKDNVFNLLIDQTAVLDHSRMTHQHDALGLSCKLVSSHDFAVSNNNFIIRQLSQLPIFGSFMAALSFVPFSGIISLFDVGHFVPNQEHKSRPEPKPGIDPLTFPLRYQFNRRLLFSQNDFIVDSVHEAHVISVSSFYFGSLNASHNNCFSRALNSHSFFFFVRGQNRTLFFNDAPAAAPFRNNQMKEFFSVNGSSVLLDSNKLECYDTKSCYFAGNDERGRGSFPVNLAQIERTEITNNMLNATAVMKRDWPGIFGVGFTNFAGMVEWNHFNATYLRIANNIQLLNSSLDLSRNTYFNTTVFAFVTNTVELIIENNQVYQTLYKDARFFALSGNPFVKMVMEKCVIRNNIVFIRTGSMSTFLGMSTADSATIFAPRNLAQLHIPVDIEVTNNYHRVEHMTWLSASPVPGIAFSIKMAFSVSGFSVNSIASSGNEWLGLDRYMMGGSSSVEDFTMSIPCDTYNNRTMTNAVLDSDNQVVLNALAMTVLGVKQEDTVLVLKESYFAPRCFITKTPTIEYKPPTPTPPLTLSSSLQPSISHSTSVSQSSSLLPPFVPSEEDVQLDSSEQAFTDSANLVSTATAAAVSASASLDAGRSLAMIALLSRCRKYEEAVQKLIYSQEARKRNGGAKSPQQFEEFREQKELELKTIFSDLYLNREIGFPESWLPGLCFGDQTRGACVRGAVVGGFLFLILVVACSFLFGAAMIWKRNKKSVSNDDYDNDDNKDRFSSIKNNKNKNKNNDKPNVNNIFNNTSTNNSNSDEVATTTTEDSSSLANELLLTGASSPKNNNKNKNSIINNSKRKRPSSYTSPFTLQQIMANARLPMFCTKAIALQLAFWITHAFSLMIASNVDFADRIIYGVLPVFGCWLAPTVLFCLYLQHAHLSRAFEYKKNSAKYRFLSCYNTKMKREDAIQIEPVNFWFPKARKLEADVTFAPSTTMIKLIQTVEEMFSGVKKNSSSNNMIEDENTNNRRRRSSSNNNNNNTSSSSSSLAARLLPGEFTWSQGSTKDSIAQGQQGSFIQQCGSIINKFYGPLSDEGKKKWFTSNSSSTKNSNHYDVALMDESSSDIDNEDYHRHHRRNNQNRRSRNIGNFLNRNNNNRNDCESFSHKSQPWRCRIAPYTVFINSLWTGAACLTQVIAALHPHLCSDSMVVMVVISGIAWLTSVLVRPNLSGMKNIAIILSDSLVFVASVLSVVAMNKSRIPATSNDGDENSSETQIENAMALASVATTLLMVSVYVGLIGSVPLLLNRILTMAGLVTLCTKAQKSKLSAESRRNESEIEEMTSMSTIRNSRKEKIRSKKQKEQEEMNREILSEMILNKKDRAVGRRQSSKTSTAVATASVTLSPPSRNVSPNNNNNNSNTSRSPQQGRTSPNNNHHNFRTHRDHHRESFSRNNNNNSNDTTSRRSPQSYPIATTGQQHQRVVDPPRSPPRLSPDRRRSFSRENFNRVGGGPRHRGDTFVNNGTRRNTNTVSSFRDI